MDGADEKNTWNLANLTDKLAATTNRVGWLADGGARVENN